MSKKLDPILYEKMQEVFETLDALSQIYHFDYRLVFFPRRDDGEEE